MMHSNQKVDDKSKQISEEKVRTSSPSTSSASSSSSVSSFFSISSTGSLDNETMVKGTDVKASGRQKSNDKQDATPVTLDDNVIYDLAFARKILFVNRQSQSIRNSSYWENKSKDETFIDELKKLPHLKNVIKYDEQFNNKRKVEFESLLAGIIRSKPRLLKKVVNHVAKSIWPEIDSAFLNSEFNKSWICQHMVDVFYADSNIKAVFFEDIDNHKDNKNSKKYFHDWIKKIIYSEKDIDVYKQLVLISVYGFFFLRPFEHMPQFKALNNEKGIQIIPDGAGDTSNKIKMRLLWKKYRGDNWPLSESLQRSRINIQHTQKCKKTHSFGIFSSEYKIDENLKKYIPSVHEHLPGMNVWRVINTSSFTNKARYVLDMPLIASQSDSIALLLIPAMVAGKLSHQELLLYNLSAMSFMVGNGHHSIHEFKPVWQAFNIHYVDGDYSSIFPEGFIQKYPELLELLESYSDLIPRKLKLNI